MNNPSKNLVVLTLVKYGISIIVFLIVVAFWVAILLIVVHYIDLGKFTVSVIILSSIAFILLLLFKPDTFFVKYKAEMVFNDDHFMLNNTKYQWKDVEWYKSNAGSNLVMGFAIGIKGKKNLKLYSTTKSGEELNAWIDMTERFEYMIRQKSIQTRNYYATRAWRIFAISILVSNVVLHITLLLFDVDDHTMIPAIVLWLFVSLPYPVIIFMNQEKG